MDKKRLGPAFLGVGGADAPFPFPFGELRKRKLLFADEITFKGVIPKDEGFSRDDYSCLKFTVNNTITPNSKNPLSKDMRKLALAFSQIKIKPN